MRFSYVNHTEIHFGQGQIASIQKHIPARAKVLIIYGGGSIKKNGVYEQVIKALDQFDTVEFQGVEPNPTMETMDKAITLAKSEKIDFILGVGGGSVIDASKYVAAGAPYNGEGWDILTGKYRVKEAIPMGAILTLAATGSESNAGSVITRKATKEKLFFASPAVQPKFAVLDPDVLLSLPERQIANGLVDAFVHTCEQYITYPTSAMIQDGYAETLLKTLYQLGKTFDQRETPEWRSNLMWSANQALNGLIGSGVPQDWATHMIGHELTALYGVDHARSLAIVQPSLLRNQIKAKTEKLEQMGIKVFDLEKTTDLADKTIEAIEAFYHSLDVDTQFSQYEGDKSEAIEALIKQLEKHGMVKLGEHGHISLEVTRNILENALA